MLYIKLALCAGIFAACIVLPARAARTYGESAHTLREIGQFMRFLRNGLIQRRPVKELLEEMNCPSERGKHGTRAGGKAGKADEGRGARP